MSSAGAAPDRLRAAVAVHAAALRAAGVRPGLAVELPPAHLRPASAAPRRLVGPEALAAILGGVWTDAGDGPVFIRDEWFPVDYRHGAAPMKDALGLHSEGMEMLTGVAAPDVDRLGFFDIETTGLSGGAGTYVVLAGLGSFEPSGPGLPRAFRVRQYFLADIAQERAMLVALAEDLARLDGYVTYNGRAFDAPVVEVRLTLARVRSPFRDRPHLDLLHAVRRLYRHRMPGCGLADAERRLLRFERADDLPGWLVPQAYFGYVRAGQVGALRAVFRHNRDDVLSLAGILVRLARLLGGDDLDPEDALAVARWHERSNQEPRALSLYQGALPLVEGGEDWAWAAARCARLLRRARRHDDAAALWHRLWREHCDPAAGLALAKHLEHHSQDLDAAASVVDQLRRETPEADGDLARRIRRIDRKRQQIMTAPRRNNP